MRYLLNGHSLVLHPELCNGCGRCEEVCPHAVFSVVNRKAAIVNREDCMECGACRLNCPHQAIAVTPGVGCVAAIVNGLRRRTAPQCGCSGGSQNDERGRCS